MKLPLKGMIKNLKQTPIELGKNYSKTYSLKSNQNSFKLLRKIKEFKFKSKEYKNSMIDKLPTNLKLIDLSPMTKVLIAMTSSVLAIAQYLDSSY